MTDGYVVLDTTEHVRNNMFRVVTDTVRMPGGEVADRDYLHHIGAVGVVALDTTDRVVLIRQYRHPLRRAIWELPAGLMDVDGEHLAAAAARELAEEADLQASTWDLLVDLNPTPGCSDEVIRVFLARDLEPVPPHLRHTRTHEEAGMVVRWVPLDDAVAMVLRGEITNAACVSGLLAAAQARASGWSTLRKTDEPLVR